jgi:hypothetical protein
MAKTRKSHPTACRGLNKTNCIFPCAYAESKLEKQRSHCYSKIKRMVKNAKTEKEKKMLKSKGKQITQKLDRAKQNMKKVNKDVKDAAKETSILSSITEFFTPKPKEETKTEEPVVEVKPEVEVEEPEKEKEKEAKTEEPETVEEEEETGEPKEEIEPAVETKTEEKKNE